MPDDALSRADRIVSTAFIAWWKGEIARKTGAAELSVALNTVLGHAVAAFVVSQGASGEEAEELIAYHQAEIRDLALKAIADNEERRNGEDRTS